MNNEGNRGGRGGRRTGAPYQGAARRTYPAGGAGPRVGRIEPNVPRAERVDDDGRFDGRSPERRADHRPVRNGSRREGGFSYGKPHARDGREAWETTDPKRRSAPAVPPRPPRAERVPLPAEDAAQENAFEGAEMENLLCGRNPIREALRAGRPVEKLLVASGDLSGAARDIIKLAKDAGVIVQYVDRARLDQIYPAHQGLLAYVAAVPYSSVEAMLDDAAEKGEEPFLILLDGITDPHNLGAIIRSAECVGAHGVIIPERRAAGLTPAAAKTAAGALNHMKIARVTNINRAIDELKERGVWIVGTSMDGESAFSADLTGPVALVIGSEGDGISQLTLKKCDRLVTLPMKGHIESLNASVAAGVMMYEIARARLL